MLFVQDDGEILRARDHREPKHFWADNELVEHYLDEIGVYAFALYMLLCYYANSRTGRAWPSIGTLADKLGVSKPTVRKYLEVLKDNKLIIVTENAHEFESGEKLFSTHVYTLLDIKSQGVVNDVYQGGKPGLLGVVNDVYPNNNESNNTNQQPRARKRDPFFDCIAQDYFGVDLQDKAAVKLVSKRVARIKKELLQADPELTAEELANVAIYLRSKNVNLTMPQHEQSIGAAVIAYRNHKRQLSARETTYVDHPNQELYPGMQVPVAVAEDYLRRHDNV